MTDKKLTDEEIIQTLECCKDCCCKQCDEEPDFQEAINLINRQKAENEMLKKRISDKKHALFEQQEYTAELQQTLETKCDDCDNIRLSRPEYWKAIKAAKAEAYKEFAERLKNEKIAPPFSINCTINMVDNLLKEMVGEDE